MKIKTILLCLFTVLIVFSTGSRTQEKPPAIQAKPVEDEYFGTKISDPYRYIENLQDPEVMQWIKAQSEYTQSVLNGIPGRQSLVDKMWELDKRKSSTITWLRIADNDRHFYLKTMPGEELAKLFYRDGYHGEESLLFDPQTFSSDTAQTYLLTNISPSDDGTKIFFVLYPADFSRKYVIITMDVENKKILERIDRDWISIAS